MSLIISELERLKSIIIHMAQNVKNVAYATKSLMEAKSLDERKRIWQEIDEATMILDKIRREFVTEVLVFMARRQPLGKELLSAYALINIIYDIYRVSRYCREIARIDSMLAPASSIAIIQNISKIFEKALKALEVAMSDLIDFMPRGIEIVNKIDEEIDKEYQEVLRIIVSEDNVSREKAIKALIMRHIERIVDHAQYLEQHLLEVL
jgi:phosphate transport system protein